ncbi:MAG TPA: Mur ligase family protein [Thermomicrobiales bacterium]|nr:Mur ligase family protein [Thermomicrobiales bacterium]
MGSEFEAYERAAESLLALIRGERYASSSAASRRQRAVTKLERITALLRAAGDPQRRYPAIHVTGTSGKGSTAAAIAGILTAAGYRVGLRTSPYLQVATEKLQIGPALIDADSFAEITARVLAAAERLLRSDRAQLPFSYAEAWSAIGYWWFAERNVDIAVVEVGAGGRFDATNVIDPLVSVITSVGLDHLVTLGPNISDIAWHKAGIIKPGSTAVVGALPEEALSIITEEAKLASAGLIQAHRLRGSGPDGRPLAQGFTGRNADVAAAVARVLVQRGFRISEAAIASGIRFARLPGRLERMPGTVEPTVWVDGAHNEDKITALTFEADRHFTGRAKPVIVVGMLSNKDPSRILASLGTAASGIITTVPSVFGRESVSADALAEAVAASGFAGAVRIEPDPDAAVRLAEDVARRDEADVLVTGSMYLAGQVRRRWFPDRDIVLQRTPWPAVIEESGLGPLRPVRRLVCDKTDSKCDEAADQQKSANVDELFVR